MLEVNPAIASLLHSGYHWCGVGELFVRRPHDATAHALAFWSHTQFTGLRACRAVEVTAPAAVALDGESSRTADRCRRGSDSGSALVSRHAAARHYARNVPAGFPAFVCGARSLPRANPCAGPPDVGAFVTLHSGLLGIVGFLRTL